MNKQNKRIILFIFGCLFARVVITFLVKNSPKDKLPYLGLLGLIPAIGFSYIYITGKRKTGGEVFGERIWWNSLRPIHAILYFLFAFLAINKNKKAYLPLLIDVNIGLMAFLSYHLKIVDF